MPACTPSVRSCTSIPRRARTPRAWVLGANTGLPPDIALHWAGEVPEDFHARYTRAAPHLSLLILNRSARSALAHARALLDAPAARCRGHARGGAGADRRARFQRLSLRRVPGALAGAARATRIAGRARRRLRVASRSPPMPSCTTWCATSSACCSMVQRDADPSGAMARMLASARSRAAPARPPPAARPVSVAGRLPAQFGLPADSAMIEPSPTG